MRTRDCQMRWRFPGKGTRCLTTRLARDILRAPAMKRYVQSEVLPGSRVNTDQELFDYACANAKTEHHPVGTCRMGRPDDPDCVVTPDLRLIALPGRDKVALTLGE